MVKLYALLRKGCLALLMFVFLGTPMFGQEGEVPKSIHFKKPISRFWFNTYGKIRFSDRFAWIAQTHFRFQEKEGTEFIGQIGQVYNRHAINYTFSKNFNASLGGVLRVNYNTKGQSDEEHVLVPEFRIWHEYLFTLPFNGIKVCHRIRVEHRWSKGFQENDTYFFRNRWRYMLHAKIPLNRPVLEPGAFYIAPEAELIMQSGKAVVNSPMEDLRLHASCGYVLSPDLKVALGFMYSMGQQLTDGDIFHQKHTIRAHIYFFPDLRKKESVSIN